MRRVGHHGCRSLAYSQVSASVHLEENHFRTRTQDLDVLDRRGMQGIHGDGRHSSRTQHRDQLALVLLDVPVQEEQPEHSDSTDSSADRSRDRSREAGQQAHRKKGKRERERKSLTSNIVKRESLMR